MVSNTLRAHDFKAKSRQTHSHWQCNAMHAPPLASSPHGRSIWCCRAASARNQRRSQELKRLRMSRTPSRARDGSGLPTLLKVPLISAFACLTAPIASRAAPRMARLEEKTHLSQPQVPKEREEWKRKGKYMDVYRPRSHSRCAARRLVGLSLVAQVKVTSRRRERVH